MTSKWLWRWRAHLQSLCPCYLFFFSLSCVCARVFACGIPLDVVWFTRVRRHVSGGGKQKKNEMIKISLLPFDVSPLLHEKRKLLNAEIGFSQGCSSSSESPLGLPRKESISIGRKLTITIPKPPWGIGGKVLKSFCTVFWRNFIMYVFRFFFRCRRVYSQLENTGK
jgi:hypothetical protein